MKGRVQHLPVSRHHWRTESGDKMKYRSFQPALWLSSAVDIQEQREASEKMKYKELSDNTAAFISCRHRAAERAR